jgi:hypothetical protein
MQMITIYHNNIKSHQPADALGARKMQGDGFGYCALSMALAKAICNALVKHQDSLSSITDYPHLADTHSHSVSMDITTI